MLHNEGIGQQMAAYLIFASLCSPAYSLLLPMLRMGDLKPDEQLDFLEQVIPYSDLTRFGLCLAIRRELTKRFPNSRQLTYRSKRAILRLDGNYLTLDL